MASAAVIDVPKLVDEQRIGRFQIQVLILCFAVLFMDGYDALAIGNVAPSLAQALHIGRPALGPVFSIGFLGAMLGTMLFGTLADSLGRRRMIIASAALFGMCTLLTVRVTSVDSLLTLRFVTGLGLGGAYPNTIALMTEFAPRRARTTLVTVMQTGIAAGAALSGIIVAWLVEAHGWATVFYVGGGAPLLLAPILVACLPESIRFLVLKGRSPNTAATILSKINPGLRLVPRPTFVLTEEHRKGVPLLHLFKDGRALGTTLLWIACFSNLLALQFLGSWLPTLIHSVGIPIGRAVWPNVLFQVGGIVGAVLLGKLADMRGVYRVLPSTLLTGAILASLAGSVGSSSTLLVFTLGIGFCIAGGQVGLNALAGAYYPTYIRSTGAGWALGFGRLGAVSSGVLGSLLLNWHWSLPMLFLADGFFALTAAVAAFLMGTSPWREVDVASGAISLRS